MPVVKCSIPGVMIIEPAVYGDSRGHFFEAYNEDVFKEMGIENRFVQDNQSFSQHGVIRGLHYQLNPYAQAKLVRVLEGRILDVAVDIRQGSLTFGQFVAVELTAENKKQLFIPAGFAHGFSVLSESAIVLYKCDSYYNRDAEGGIRFDDPELGIDWQVNPDPAKISEKDLALPLLKDCRNNFQFEL